MVTGIVCYVKECEHNETGKCNNPDGIRIGLMEITKDMHYPVCKKCKPDSFHIITDNATGFGGDY